MDQAPLPREQPTADHSRYIPLSVDEVIRLCADHMPTEQRPTFVQFATLIHAWYHHQFLSQARDMKAAFAQDPAIFADHLDRVVRDANFEPITRQDLNNALAEESVFKLRLQVDFSDFEDIVFYRRGPSQRTAEVKTWLGLRRKQIEFTNYDLVLVYVRFREQIAGEEPPAFEPGSALLKLFKNVPKADLEMLFPNSQVRMRNLDKLLIGVPAFVSGVAIFTSKVGGTLLLIGGVVGFWLGLRGEPVTLDQSALAALLTGATALGGYLWKQYSNFNNRKIRFMKALTENLYFKTVGDNEGVISHLLDQAEDAQTKEVLLAYTALIVLQHPTADEISSWVAQQLDCDITFDIADALTKLQRLNLSREHDGRYRATPLDQGYTIVDQMWDDLFIPHS